ncbi:hypothetical protein RBU61_05945 [Tissierella sp. MB52-C2]|uniref:hypothetical protein n=1 Tax=Tissierella sp. MB52-C2 TaxID=3070999 RepID=UPI00280BC6A9|nr:hypothetical protein [Tissierella sp. MB52-C2]WMM26215.1 hypothetical protein RBU61_05945 [Tissierella sp. MB52-C2]
MDRNIIILIILGVYMLINGSISNLNRKIDKLNKRLDKLLEHSDLAVVETVDKELEEKLIQLLKEGKKVKAVKTLRDEIDMDLIDAKEYIDGLDETLKKIFP